MYIYTHTYTDIRDLDTLSAWTCIRTHTIRTKHWSNLELAPRHTPVRKDVARKHTGMEDVLRFSGHTVFKFMYGALPGHARA